jgi:hypothetical protein
VYDLPTIINIAKSESINSPFHNKIEYKGGNFFETIPEGADTIVMSRVLHDWADDKAIKILKNVYNALPENGKLLIFETVVPEDTEKNMGFTLNFDLLVMVGGKERTRKDFESILVNADFEISKIIESESVISLVICRKAPRSD